MIVQVHICVSIHHTVDLHNEHYYNLHTTGTSQGPRVSKPDRLTTEVWKRPHAKDHTN